MAADADAQGVGVDDLVWAVPYLPVDPKDLGRSYEAVIRVNSQSGKGGVAYLLKQDHALDLPRRLQIEFSAVVQAHTDSEGGEVSSDAIWRIFQDEYLPMTDAAQEGWGRYELTSTHATNAGDGVTELTIDYRVGEDAEQLVARGNGPIDAFVNGLNDAGHRVALLRRRKVLKYDGAAEERSSLPPRAGFDNPVSTAYASKRSSDSQCERGNWAEGT